MISIADFKKVRPAVQVELAVAQAAEVPEVRLAHPPMLERVSLPWTSVGQAAPLTKAELAVEPLPLRFMRIPAMAASESNHRGQLTGAKRRKALVTYPTGRDQASRPSLFAWTRAI